MASISAGILPFRRTPEGVDVYLVHMGGPYWRRKRRSWSVVKGEAEEGEALLDAAKQHADQIMVVDLDDGDVEAVAFVTTEKDLEAAID